MVADLAADMEVDKVADMFADIVAKKGTYFGKKKKGTQFGERVGHRGWLIGPKFFRPKAYPTCMSSKLCEFIEEEVYHFILKSILFDFLLAPLGALSAPKIKVACVMATLFSYGRDSFQMLRYHFCTSFLS